ncbi:hypothetical protein K1719_014645 [Acacia pycnantha]|nr:hypothetical protein K1719_014645 [Acacia pycnantha]
MGVEEKKLRCHHQSKRVLSLVFNALFPSLQRRGYVVSVSHVPLSSSGDNRVGKPKDTSAIMNKQGFLEASSAWVPDPVIDYYKSNNHSPEINSTELWLILLNQITNHCRRLLQFKLLTASLRSYRIRHLLSRRIATTTRVFLLGPSHHYYTPKCALSVATVYKTPIGDLPIDLEVNEELKATGKFLELNILLFS